MNSFRRVAVLLMLLAPAGLRAQARVSVDSENLRAAPAGVVVAQVFRGTPLRLGEHRDRWVEATLEGWVWAASVQHDGAAGHDLRVSAPEGENLRAAPNGERRARLGRGTLLDSIGARDRWIHVRRAAWIWSPSVSGAASTGESPADSPAESPQKEGTRVTAPAPAAAGDSLPAAWLPDSVAAARVAVRGAPLLTAPDGDTVAALRPLGRVAVVERRDGWVRVRVDGWVPAAMLSDAADTLAVLGDDAAAALAAGTDALRGRRVRWTLRFISVQQADSVRRDFRPGERFVLARGPGERSGLVYLAVPDSLRSRVAALRPLEAFTALARIRTPRSKQTGAPVLELLDIL